MKFNATKFVSLLLVLAVNKNTASVLKFQSSTNVIHSLLTREMTMRCSLEDTAALGPGAIVGRSVTATPSDVISLTSLVLMKGGTEIAHVIVQTAATAMNNANVKVEGQLNKNATEKGYLEVTWTFPTEGDVGEFTCEANGLTASGHNVVFTKSLEVEVKVPTTSDLVQTIHELMHVETGFIDCNNSNSWPGREKLADGMDGIYKGYVHRYVNVTQPFQRSYATPPVVHLAVRDLHITNNPYFQFYVVNVDRDQFTMKCRGFNDGRIDQMSVSWVAIAK